jgi:hypothetical protein
LRVAGFDHRGGEVSSQRPDAGLVVVGERGGVCRVAGG